MSWGKLSYVASGSGSPILIRISGKGKGESEGWLKAAADEEGILVQV